MSEDGPIYNPEWILRIKLAQFGAVISHLLCDETLSPDGCKALQLLEEKCKRRNLADCISDAEFKQYGLSEKLCAWEMLGFQSEADFLRANQRQVSDDAKIGKPSSREAFE